MKNVPQQHQVNEVQQFVTLMHFYPCVIRFKQYIMHGGFENIKNIKPKAHLPSFFNSDLTLTLNIIRLGRIGIL